MTPEQEQQLEKTETELDSKADDAYFSYEKAKEKYQSSLSESTTIYYKIVHIISELYDSLLYKNLDSIAIEKVVETKLSDLNILKSLDVFKNVDNNTAESFKLESLMKTAEDIWQNAERDIERYIKKTAHRTSFPKPKLLGNSVDISTIHDLSKLVPRKIVKAK